MRVEGLSHAPRMRMIFPPRVAGPSLSGLPALASTTSPVPEMLRVLIQHSHLPSGAGASEVALEGP